MAVTALQNRYARLANEWATLAAAVTAIGSDPVTLILPAGWTDTLAAGVTIPTTLRLEARGGVVTLGGFTLTINGPFECGPHQAFSGTGVVFGDGAVQSVDPRWWGADATGVTDAGVAIAAACTALQASGGGTLLFSKGMYTVFTVGVAYTRLAQFVGLSHIRIINQGATLAMDPARTFSDEEVYGTCFEFYDSKNIELSGFKVTGPDLSAVFGTQIGPLGVGFITFREGCMGVRISNCTVQGAAWGADFDREFDDDEDWRSSNIDISAFKVSEAYYGLVTRHSGHNLRADIEVENCFRSFFTYGTHHQDVRVNQKDVYNDACLVRSFDGKGVQDLRLHVHDTESTLSRPDSSKVSFGWTDSTPGTFKNISIDFHVVYPAGEFGGAECFVLDKYHDGAYDATDRGHVIDGLTISGYIEGTPEGGVCPITAEQACQFLTGETFRNITFKNLRVKSSQWWRFPVGSLKDTLVLDHVLSDSEIALYSATSDYQIVQFGGSVKVWASEAPNLYSVASNVGGSGLDAYPILHRISVVDPYSVPAGWGDGEHLITNVNHSATRTYTLPASAVGLGFNFLRVSSFALRIAPHAADIIAGAGAVNKYLELDTNGDAVSLRCVVAGRWEIVAGFGTYAYQP